VLVFDVLTEEKVGNRTQLPSCIDFNFSVRRE